MFKAKFSDEQGNMYGKLAVYYYVGLEGLTKAAVMWVGNEALRTHEGYEEIVPRITRKNVEESLRSNLTAYGRMFLEVSPNDFNVGLYHPDDVDELIDELRAVVEELFPDFRWGQ